jgi:hypothetical protein
MGLFSDVRAFAARFVNGDGDATVEAIREADAMLAQIRSRRSSIFEELRGLRSERDKLLTSDESTGRRREIREAIDDLEEQQQGLDRVEREHAASRARLLTVRNREVLQAGAVRYSEEVARWAEAAEALIAAGNAARQIRRELQAGGFRSELTMFFPEIPSAGETFLAGRSVVDRFEVAVATSRRALDNRPADDQKYIPPPQHPIVMPIQANHRGPVNVNGTLYPADSQEAILHERYPQPARPQRPKRVPPPPPAPPAPPRDLLTITDAVPEGLVAVHFRRAGIPLHDRLMSRIGDEVALPARQAEQLFKNGAAVIPEAKP